MFAIDSLKNESMIYESNMPKLNVPAMTDPILKNYDMHVNNFIQFLKDNLNIYLIYDGPDDIHQHILQKTTYACSVYCKPKKILKNVFPIMIRSRLDLAIRYEGMRSFKKPFELLSKSSFPFNEFDIGLGFFIIGGYLRHLPYLYTNDATNTHVIQRKTVRVYSYNAQDRGKELNFYVSDTKTEKCGDVVVVHNDGSKTNDDPHFFDHCPYPIHLTAYMNQLYRDELFDIDHLGNKIVISPGHMFTKLFIKYLYGPLREQDWKSVKSRTTLICNSIENGRLLHVLSRKTVYHKEGKSAGKMTNEPQESHREIGANGEIFMEKNIGSYREVPTQTYPLNPYLLYVIVRQLSNKINNSEVESFHPSYLHFFCILGIFETKNVGRTTMMVRNTIVSTCNDLDPVYHDKPNEKFWKTLNIETEENSPYYVVVNDACIPVSKRYFFNLDLLNLKKIFGTIECYERGKFIVIRYKMGMIMRQLPHVLIWVTPYDQVYWCRRLFGVENDDESPLTSYIVDFNAFYKHTSFAKNILAFNAMKNAVLATNPKYTRYFMDTLSVYYHAPTSSHKVLLEPEDDGISEHFTLLLPQPIVVYMSYKGCTQEDCIVKRKKYNGFDCYRFHTLRIKLNKTSWVKFYPIHGDENPESDLLGTLISGEPLEVEPFSIHVRLVKISPCEYEIHFSKQPFRMVQHFITGQMLIICVEQEHIASTADKLCTLHGQKGVFRVMENVPTVDGIEPDLVVSVYGIFRSTPGQFLEARCFGGGKDAKRVCNSSGIEYKNASALYGRTFYFSIVYWACEHLYAPMKCVLDRVTHQPVKGRSRGGGMKLGNMEVNALRGNGIAFCFEEKFFEDGDRVPDDHDPTQAKPKSIGLIVEDAKAYKFNLQFNHSPTVIDKTTDCTNFT